MLYTYWSLCLRKKAIVMSWNNMTSYMIDLTWSGQFHITTSRGWLSHPLSDLLSKSTFQINISNQPFKSIFRINFLNQPTQSTFLLNWWCHWYMVRCFLRQMYVYKRVYSYLLRYVWFKWLTFLQITHLSSYGIYHARASLDSDVDKSPTRCS